MLLSAVFLSQSLVLMPYTLLDSVVYGVACTANCGRIPVVEGVSAVYAPYTIEGGVPSPYDIGSAIFWADVIKHATDICPRF